MKTTRARENRDAAECDAVETEGGSRRVLGAVGATVSPRREPLPSRVLDGQSALDEIVLTADERAGQDARAELSPAPPRPAAVRAEREPLPADATHLPALPDVFHATLRSGVAELGLDLDAASIDALDAFVRLLLRWTQAINLTAIRDPEAVARDHLVDSLSAAPLLRELGAVRILDLGSGGGLPGIPLAIALPDAQVLLVESIVKKAAFLRTAVAAAGAVGLPDRVGIEAARAEDLAASGRDREQWDVVTVRAVAALPELIELAFPLLRVGGHLVAWKREPIADELAAASNAARALSGAIDVRDVPVSALADRRLVVVEKTRPTPPRYPRAPAERRTRPL